MHAGDPRFARDKKLIVAGAGMGKTYTFGKVIEQRKGGKKLGNDVYP